MTRTFATRSPASLAVAALAALAACAGRSAGTRGAEAAPADAPPAVVPPMEPEVVPPMGPEVVPPPDGGAVAEPGGPTPVPDVAPAGAATLATPAAAAADAVPATGPLAATPCGELAPLLGAVIREQAEDDRAQAALGRCLASGALEGRPRAEIEALLGPGEPCDGYFGGFGFAPDDVYYAIGRLPETMVGGVPNLVLHYDAAGRCVRAQAIHTQ